MGVTVQAMLRWGYYPWAFHGEPHSWRVRLVALPHAIWAVCQNLKTCWRHGYPVRDAVGWGPAIFRHDWHGTELCGRPVTDEVRRLAELRRSGATA